MENENRAKQKECRMTEEKSLAVSEVTVPNFEIREKHLGILVTNAREVRDAIKAKMREFSLDAYAGDAKQAAEDKANLNNLAKRLNEERINLEREFMKPFNEFKDIVSESVKLIETASAQLGTIVKEKERLEKEAKRAEIQKIWDSQNFSLVSLERVFNQKWLNKGTKLAAVEKEVLEIISKIQGDLGALDSFGEDTENLKGFYLSTLNLQMALSRGAELKANRERLAARKAEEERRRAEEEARLAQEKTDRERRRAETEEPQNAGETALSNEAAKERAREIRENLAKTADETLAAPELPKQETEATSEKKYLFTVTAEPEILVRVVESARSIGMSNVPSFTFEATETQIEQLKRQFVADEFVYEKTRLLTLEVKR